MQRHHSYSYSLLEEQHSNCSIPLKMRSALNKSSVHCPENTLIRIQIKRGRASAAVKAVHKFLSMCIPVRKHHTNLCDFFFSSLLRECEFSKCSVRLTRPAILSSNAAYTWKRTAQFPVMSMRKNACRNSSYFQACKVLTQKDYILRNIQSFNLLSGDWWNLQSSIQPDFKELV